MMKKVIGKISKKKSMTSTRATKSDDKPKKAVRRKTISSEEFMKLIEQKAYYLWQERGNVHGNDQYYWYEAERSLQDLYKVK